MPKRISNQMLERQMSHLTQYVPDVDMLEGKCEGSSHFVKVEESTYVEAVKKSHRTLGGLTDKYELTQEQKDLVKDRQTRLISDIEEAFEFKQKMPANLSQFIANVKAS